MNIRPSEVLPLDLSQPIRHWAEQKPDALAISTNDVRLSYADLDDRVTRCAAFLTDHGVTDHEVCGLDISDRLFFVICWFALFRLQVTSTAFSPDTAINRRESIARKCGVGVIISEFGKKLPGTQLVHADLSQVLAHPFDAERQLKRGNSEHAMLIVGSGTTGQPKMIAVSFDAILTSGPTESSIWGQGPNDVTFTTVNPWVSSAPLKVFNSLYRGGAFHIWSDTNLSFFDALEKAGVNKVFAVVSQTEKMIGVAIEIGRRLPNEPELTIYASVVTEGLVRRVKQSLTKRVKTVYAANELGAVADIDLTTETRPLGSVGRLSAGAKIEIVNWQDEPLPIGEAGLVRARAPRLFSKYIDEPEETTRALRKGWFYPGDVARIEADGHIVLLGRSDHVMIHDGVNIHPAEIENVVSTHPAVADVAVMPMKDIVKQDIPICAVVALPGQQVSEDELRQFAKERLAERTPGRVIILDQIPRNESGKAVRKELARRLTEELCALTRD